MANLYKFTFEFSGDGPYRRDVPRALAYAESMNPDKLFNLNIVYNNNWFDTQTIVVDNHNLALQLKKFLTDMTQFLNNEALHMELYQIVFENNIVASG